VGIIKIHEEPAGQSLLDRLLNFQAYNFNRIM